MSRGSRGASDVLAQIRSVITHLEKKDRKLNNELQSLRLIGSGSESDQIKNAQAEITRLSSQKSKLTADLEESKTSCMQIRQENEILHEQLDNEIKLSKQHQGENNTLKIKNQGLEKDLDSHNQAIKNLQKKKDDLENENAALKQNITQLTSKPASSDQARLQQDNVLLAQQLNDAKAEVKRYFDLYENNRNNATVYKRLMEQKDIENETLKEQNAKFIRGAAAPVQSGSGALAGSPGLASPYSPPPVSARVAVEHTKDPNVSANADISHKNDENQPAAQEGGGLGSLLGSTVRGVANAVSYLTGSKGGVDPTTTADGRGGQDSGSADSESDDRSDDRDETAAGSPSGGPDKVSPPYTVTAVVKDNKNGENTAPAAATGSKTQVLADDEDVIKMKATELSIFITSRGWIASENNYTSKYKCFLENESLDNLMKYKLKYNLLGDDRESIINSLNKIAFECNVMTTLGVPAYREMKEKYKFLPELENKKTPPKDQIAEALSKMDRKKRSELTRDIVSNKLTTIPGFKDEASKCNINIDVSRAKGSVKNLYPQVYEVSVS